MGSRTVTKHVFVTGPVAWSSMELRPRYVGLIRAAVARTQSQRLFTEDA